MESEGFFHDCLQVWEVWDVGFLHNTVGSHHEVELVLGSFQAVAVQHEFSHPPLDRRGVGVGSSGH